MKKIILSVIVVCAFGLTANAQMKKPKMEKGKATKVDPKLKKAAGKELNKAATKKANEKATDKDAKATKPKITATDVKKANKAKGKLKKKK